MRDELRDIVRDGRGDDLARGAGLHDPPALHQRDAVADLECLVEIVADKDDGAPQPGLKLQQLILKAGADQRVERREGLIHQQDRRLGGKSAREPHALLHAPRQLAHLAPAPLRQPHEVELRRDAAGALGPRHAREFEAEAHILGHRPPGQKAELLKDHGDAPAPERAQLRL